MCTWESTHFTLRTALTGFPQWSKLPQIPLACHIIIIILLPIGNYNYCGLYLYSATPSTTIATETPVSPTSKWHVGI